MNSLFVLRTLLFAGELFAGSALVMMLAFLGSTQKSASVRHLVWLGAFGALLLLPLFAAILPSPLHLRLTASYVEPVASHDAAMAATMGVPQPGHTAFDPAVIVLGTAMIWLAGVCALLLRLVASFVCLALLRRSSRLYALAPEDMPRIAATRRECELRLAQSEHGPVTFGLFRPVILLPKTATAWPRARLHAVLLHELAHIRRRDGLAKALSALVCAFYWPNPLVWLGARRLRREAEMAADDAVLLNGVRPSHYAGELLTLAEEFRVRNSTLAHAALFMAAPSSLKARVEAVLAPTAHRRGVTAMDVWRSTGLGLVAAAVLACACPSLAQQSDTAPLPPPAAPPAPAAPAAVAVPDAAPMAPTPPVQAAKPSEAVPPAPFASAEPKHVRGIIIDDNGHTRWITRNDMKQIRADVARAEREAREAIARERPEIDRALAQAREAEAASRAVREAQPQIDAAMAQVARVRPEIDAAMAQVHDELAKMHLEATIEARVDEAMKRAEARIQASEGRARVRADVQLQNDDSAAPDNE